MEVISATQLQKYEDIIDQIKIEFEKYGKLKQELEKENDNITVSQVANSKLTERVSHVNVKMFADLIELVNLYHGELQSDCYKLLKYDHCKFYLIEIYITKVLIQKIRDLNWLLNITIKNDNISMNKTIPVTCKIPILEVIPINESEVNFVVEASLVLPSGDKWMVIKLDTVYVDISHHFQKYNAKQTSRSKIRDILKITSRYKEEINMQDLQRQIKMEYSIFCDLEKSEFINSILRNCYHKLDIELFSEMGNDDKRDFTLQFSTGQEKQELVYNRGSKSLVIKSNANDLCMLKKYFCKECLHQIATNIHTIPFTKLKNHIPDNAQEAILLYKEVRKSWTNLLT